MKPLALAVAVALALVFALGLAPSRAFAEDLRVGIYAPSAGFAGTSARLDYVKRLADHLARNTGGGKGTGKVYARASDFSGAVRGGALEVAVVDASYLAAIGAPYTVIATSTRGGASAAPWQIVTRGGERAILDLKGKKLLCPSIGGRESDFVHHALLGSELPRGFFAAITTSPDTVSALAALGLGRADAAVVPSGVDLPSGITRVASLPAISLPVLVVFGGNADLRKRIASAATRFDGGDVLAGFDTGGGEAVKGLARRFARVERRGPMVIPNLRVTVENLVEARKPVIRRVDVQRLLAAPPALPPPTARR